MHSQQGCIAPKLKIGFWRVKNSEIVAEVRVSVRCDSGRMVRETQQWGFEDGCERRSVDRLQNRKRQGADLLELSGRKQLCSHCDFSPVRSVLDF